MNKRPMGTTFADLLGKLDVVVVECRKCSRTGVLRASQEPWISETMIPPG